MPKKVVTLEAKERVYDPAKYTSYVKQSSRILYWLALLLMVVLNFLNFLLLALLIARVAAVNLFSRTFLVNALRGNWELPLAGGAGSESLAYAIMFIIPY